MNNLLIKIILSDLAPVADRSESKIKVFAVEAIPVSCLRLLGVKEVLFLIDVLDEVLLLLSNYVKGFSFLIFCRFVFLASIAFKPTVKVIVLTVATDPSAFRKTERLNLGPCFDRLKRGKNVST